MRFPLSPRTLLLATGTATLLAGCTVGPNFTPPAAPGTTAYRPASDKQQAAVANTPAVEQGNGPALRWWTAFGSPQLDTLVNQAIAHNASLEASNATLAASREEVAAIRGKQLPQVDANGRIEHEQANLAAFGFKPNPALGLSGNPEFDLYSVGGGVSFDLDPFGKLRRGTEEAAAKAEAQLRQTEAAHLTVAGQVVNQVLTIAAIRARIATANTLLQDDQRNVDLTRKRKQAGEGTLVEVLNAQSQFENDRSDIPQLNQQLAEARHLLATLCGIAPADLGPTDFDLDTLTLPQSIPVALPSKLVHKRPDILQAEANLHAATAAVGVATANLYPDITIGATISQGSNDLAHLLSNSTRGFDFFGGLLAPIFHGGTLKAEKRAAVDRAKAADATYRQTVLDAFRQVANLLQAVDSDAQSVHNQQEAVSVAQHSLHLSRRSYQVGNTGILQTLDAERQYQRAQSGLVEARARQFLNVAHLYVATAGGWTGDPTQTAASH
ncbi:efflux transporter outer membrane subunit [Stakelama sediminis]|uniref:NodT family efflux transporter outer membrane factor (OMF) lipoprotein n=1 Tax=Stakelama sediminis TaxID=463200 RepID=A0A840Z1C9_9SPHN|nr:efflux transporter outer membrane subunit [Stakelama sediminis]MBB5719589.1 NodT family efflux transporter outer membrane factor (OMF) lipoprotein [Stakelama sediminis]